MLDELVKLLLKQNTYSSVLDDHFLIEENSYKLLNIPEDNIENIDDDDNYMTK